jgi:DmsE family decaheme c-type cytochrome
MEPGKAHMEEGDPAKIISFKNKPAKEISETCLTCHAGKEERNNFRRGEHWRNDVGCTDCHSSHSLAANRNVAKSITFIGTANAEKPDFNKPFHHKVLEGVMKCSDCHNPHAVSSFKQTRLATGADAACIKCHADKEGTFHLRARTAQDRWLRGLSYAARLSESETLEIQSCKPTLSDLSQRRPRRRRR